MWRYCKPRFERLLLEELQRQQRGSMFCDTVLQAGGISVPAHSCVLSALSPQFAHALSVAPTACAGQNQLIEFQTVDARTLLKLVGFFYSGELDVEGEQEREKVITAVSKLGIGSLVNVGRQGDGELGGIWEGANELFNQVEGKKETGVQTDCQNERQRRVWTMTEGDKEDERVTLARQAAQLPTTTRDRETQTELGDLTQNWTNTGTQNITSSGNGMDPDPLQLRAANSNTQLLSHTSVTVNSSESHSRIPPPCSSELIPVHTGLEPLQSCPMPSATGDGQAGESSVATTACETHATNEDTVALTGTQLKSSSFTKDIIPAPAVSDTALYVPDSFAPDLSTVAAGPVSGAASQAAAISDPEFAPSLLAVVPLSSSATECLHVAETDIDPLPVLNAAHGHLEPGVPMVDTTVAPLIHLVPSVPVSLLFLPSVAEGYPSAHHTVLHIPQLSSQTSEPPPTPVYVLPSSLSSCLPSSAPQVSVMQAALSTDSQKTATTAVEVGEALGLESVAAGVDDGVVALEDGNTEGFDRFEGNIPGFINYFLNRSSSKKGSTRARTGQRRGGIKRKSAPTRSSKGGTQTECEVPSRGTVTKEAEKTSSESRRLVQGSRHWRPPFGTILQTWRRGEGGGVVGQWSGVMARLEQRQSIRLKLKRQSGEGMWEIVKVEEKAGRVRALSEIGRASRRGRGQPHRRACQPSLSEDTFPIIKRPRSRLRIHPVPCPPAPRQLINALSCDTLPAQQLAPVPQAPLLPNSNCPPQQTLGSAVLHTAPLSPAQVSPVRPISPASPVNPEEPVGQIDKLLEDILLGLNFFPPNSTISQDSYPKSYLPSSTGGLDPDPTVRPCGIQQEQELGVLDSDLSPTESSTRAFLSPSETATSSSTTLCFGTHSATSRTSCPRASDPFPESFLGISTEPSLEFCHCPLSPSAMCSQVPDTSTKSSSECEPQLAATTAVSFTQCSSLPDEIGRALLLLRSGCAGSPVAFSPQDRSSTLDAQGKLDNLSLDASIGPKTTSLEVSSAPPIDAPRISQHEAAELNEILDHILQSCEHPSALQSLEEGKQGSQGSTLEDRLEEREQSSQDSTLVLQTRANDMEPRDSEAQVRDGQLQITCVRETSFVPEQEQKAGSRTNHVAKHAMKALETSQVTSDELVGAQYTSSSAPPHVQWSSKQQLRWVSPFCSGLQTPLSSMDETKPFLGAPSHKGSKDQTFSSPTKMQPVPTSFATGPAQNCKLQGLLRNRQDFVGRTKFENQQLSTVTRSQSKGWTLRTRTVETDDDMVQTDSNKRKLPIKAHLQTVMQREAEHVVRKVSRTFLRDRIFWLGKDNGCKLCPGTYDRPERIKLDGQTTKPDLFRDSKMQVGNNSGADKVPHGLSRDIWKTRDCVVRLVDINIYLGKKSADHAEQWESRNSKMKTGRACTEKSPVIILEKLAEINSLTDKRTKTSDVSGTECNSRNHRVQKWPRGRLRKSTQEVKRDAAVTSGTTAAGVTDVCGVEKGAGRTGEQQWEGGGLLTRGRKRKMEDTGDMWYLGPEPEQVGSLGEADPVQMSSALRRPSGAIALQTPTPGPSLQIGEHLKPARWSPGLSVRKKSTLKSSSVSKRCSSAFDKTKELQQHNQCKRMLMKSRATEGYGRQTEEQGDQEGQRCHRDREITQGVALWNEWSHTDGGGLPEEQPVNRKAEDDGCEEAVNVEVLEEQPRECSEEGDDGEDTHAEMGRMDKADDGEIKNGDRGERGRNEQSMSPTQSTVKTSSTSPDAERIRRGEAEDAEEVDALQETGHLVASHQFRSATEPSSQMPPRATNETLEWEEEDAEVDVVECSSPFPIALIKPLLTLDDGSSSPSPSEGEDEEDEEIDVVGEETD